ncbi:DNA polymerase III subunit delta' [Alteromonas sp. H39]|uniref:DNA polymerase III subunit delta' n=1 Tax=Alteromonas sp. H39 TaxID=3389876 RepID=UPI0039DF9692
MNLPWLTSVFNQLTGRFLANRLHHALLFCGPAGIGKLALAEAFSKTLLCQKPSSLGACEHCQSCALLDANTHPDFHILESKKQLGVDKIREGIGKLSATSQLGRNKVLVIPNADAMTDSAANALLKTLEEPTNNTFIMLLTDKVQHLLPTILSRCERTVLALPPEHQSLAWLQQQGLEDASPALLQAYGGAPLKLIDAMNKDGEGLSFRAFNEGVDALLAGSTTALSLATTWQDAARQVVNWCQQRAHKAFIINQRMEDYAAYSESTQAAKQLQHPGINKVIVLTRVLERLTRPTAY